jgi:hypothetical protein
MRTAMIYSPRTKELVINTDGETNSVRTLAADHQSNGHWEGCVVVRLPRGAKWDLWTRKVIRR